MKTVSYSGVRTLGGAEVVRVDAAGLIEPLPVRLDLRKHSPTGFEWGYGGSGPAQLALAILADAVGDDLAELWYQEFKWDAIARLEGDRWSIARARIIAWLRRRRNSERRRDARFSPEYLDAMGLEEGREGDR